MQDIKLIIETCKRHYDLFNEEYSKCKPGTFERGNYSGRCDTYLYIIELLEDLIDER